MFLGVILSLHIASCYCFVAYEIFQGFGTVNTTTATSVTKHINQTTQKTHNPMNNSFLNRTISPKFQRTTISPTTPIQPVTSSKFRCPEEELPTNIGAYEVPTQRDIVLLVRKTLKRLFNVYHQKALDFLKDIKEATKATKALEKKCRGYENRRAYRRCVRQVSGKCEAITKGLVTSLEKQRRDVQAFTNGTVCNVKGMKADPVELIKTLAMEEASLEFALPGFLRLLSACSINCNKMTPQAWKKKPLRHMTDQDLVVKHFLTKKSYIQLLKGSK